jgi:hypothetical protein
LIFADDLLVCGEATVQEAARMKQILQDFCIRSGQTPNWTKYGIIFSTNVTQSEKQSIKHFFPFPDIKNNFLHLGHPLIIPGKDRTFCILEIYKADQLSHAATLELIKYVFSFMHVYYLSNILFTKKFIVKLTTIIRNFWWMGIREETNSRSFI